MLGKTEINIKLAGLRSVIVPDRTENMEVCTKLICYLNVDILNNNDLKDEDMCIHVPENYTLIFLSDYFSLRKPKTN